jgi:molybdopterin converting factor small subunit
VHVELPEPATVGQLRTALVQQHPALARVVPRAMIAVDSEYAEAGAVVREGAQVACIPPVSGG